MITDLRLQHFRSYSDDSYEFSSGVNIIVGPNASGKTNLLEAILVLAHGSSYRSADSELIGFGQPWARLDGHSENSAQRTLKLMAKPLPGKAYELDGKTYKRLSLSHKLPVVLFEPNHLGILSGGPERRRDYLDDLLEQTTPGYTRVRRDYKRTLMQRNRLLKQPGAATPNRLFPWSLRLAQLAGVTVRARAELSDQLKANLDRLYRELSGTKTVVTAAYGNQWPVDAYESRLLKKLEAVLDDDRRRGFTGYGPHREDLVVSFSGRPAQATASRGELRTAVLALKIIELQLVWVARQITPLLLLDDVFSELDGRRRHGLIGYLAPYQTFITTTDADLVVQHFASACHIIPLASSGQA